MPGMDVPVLMLGCKKGLGLAKCDRTSRILKGLVYLPSNVFVSNYMSSSDKLTCKLHCPCICHRKSQETFVTFVAQGKRSSPKTQSFAAPLSNVFRVFFRKFRVHCETRPGSPLDVSRRTFVMMVGFIVL